MVLALEVLQQPVISDEDEPLLQAPQPSQLASKLRLELCCCMIKACKLPPRTGGETTLSRLTCKLLMLVLRVGVQTSLSQRRQLLHRAEELQEACAARIAATMLRGHATHVMRANCCMRVQDASSTCVGQPPGCLTF